jgi:F-type H+-transporting ATPase subunit delta
LISGSIARRYAKALLAIGVDLKDLENLGSQVNKFTSLLENEDLRDTLQNPAYPISKRKAIVQQLIQRLNLSKIVSHFLLLLMDRQRLNLLPSIAREYRQLVDDHLGRVRALVTTAAPLDLKQTAQLKEALEQKTGKKILLEQNTNPELIAGMVTQIGSIIYDGSIRTRLEQMRQTLLAGEQ